MKQAKRTYTFSLFLIKIVYVIAGAIVATMQSHSQVIASQQALAMTCQNCD
ncbi:MAG: hypothetical protein MZV64_17655 [Ignavibacteriales bacterium]|nr:hypothetical protein [Ignavibacteriales bacterium]